MNRNQPQRVKLAKQYKHSTRISSYGNTQRGMIELASEFAFPWEPRAIVGGKVWSRKQGMVSGQVWVNLEA